MLKLLILGISLSLAASSYVADEYWSTVGFDGSLKDGRTPNDFLPFERVDREGRRTNDAYVAYWITRTKYDPHQHYEAFGQAWIEQDGRICARFVGYEREKVELCAGFRILSKHSSRNEAPPFKWVRADEADLQSTVGFRDHRAARLEWLNGEIFYGDARLSDKNFQGISPAYNQLVEIANPLEFSKKVWILAKTTPDEVPRHPPPPPPPPPTHHHHHHHHDRDRQPAPEKKGESKPTPPAPASSPKGYVYVRIPKQRQQPAVVYVDKWGHVVGYGQPATTRSNISYVNPHSHRNPWASYSIRPDSNVRWTPQGVQGVRSGVQAGPSQKPKQEEEESGEEEDQEQSPQQTKTAVDPRYSIPGYPNARGYLPVQQIGALPYAAQPVYSRYIQPQQVRPAAEAKALEPEIVPLPNLKEQSRVYPADRPRWQQRVRLINLPSLDLAQVDEDLSSRVKNVAPLGWIQRHGGPVLQRPHPFPPQGIHKPQPPIHAQPLPAQLPTPQRIQGKLPQPKNDDYTEQDVEGEEEEGEDYN